MRKCSKIIYKHGYYKGVNGFKNIHDFKKFMKNKTEYHLIKLYKRIGKVVAFRYQELYDEQLNKIKNNTEFIEY